MSGEEAQENRWQEWKRLEAENPSLSREELRRHVFDSIIANPTHFLTEDLQGDWLSKLISGRDEYLTSKGNYVA